MPAPIAAPLPCPIKAPMPAPTAAPAPVPTAVFVCCCVAQPASSVPAAATTAIRLNIVLEFMATSTIPSVRRIIPA
ncbi:hypothetical protein D3C72_2227300 [compost metagenome]